MRSRVLWRRSATALGVYIATALGFLTTVVATRELGTGDYARFAAIVAATAFLQLLLDLTVEEALVKYGFRYAEAERWGRLRRLFEVALGFKLVGGLLGALALVALAPFARRASGASSDVLVPMLVASAAAARCRRRRASPAGAMILRGRYDVRGAFLAVSMGAAPRRASGSAALYGPDGRRDRDGDRAGRSRPPRSRSSGSRVPPLPAARVRAARRRPARRARVRRLARRSPRRSSRRARRSARR